MGKAKAVEDELKELEKLMQKLRTGCILVEGKRDKLAFEKLGCRNVIPTVGRARVVCESLSSHHFPSFSGVPSLIYIIYIMTDFDRRGKQLAENLRLELESLSLSGDMETRKRLGRILRVKFFEDVHRLYNKKIEEMENGAFR